MPVFDLQLDVTWLSLLATVLLPMLTAVVTARLAHPGLKAGVLALLALVTTFVNELLSTGGAGSFDTGSWLATAAGVFLGAVGLHYGLLKPIQLTGSQGVIAAKLEGGVGGSREIPGPQPYSMP